MLMCTSIRHHYRLRVYHAFNNHDRTPPHAGSEARTARRGSGCRGAPPLLKPVAAPRAVAPWPLSAREPERVPCMTSRSAPQSRDRHAGFLTKEARSQRRLNCERTRKRVGSLCFACRASPRACTRGSKASRAPSEACRLGRLGRPRRPPCRLPPVIISAEPPQLSRSSRRVRTSPRLRG